MAIIQALLAAVTRSAGKLLNTGDQTLKRVHPDWPRPVMAMDDGHAFPAPVGTYRPNGSGEDVPVTADFFPAYDDDGGLLVALTPK